MPKRRLTVVVPPTEAARLRAFDNTTDAGVSWPLGPNRSFRRRGRRRFAVKDYSSMGPGKALVTTLGTAVFLLGGWGLFLRRPDAETELDAVEQVLRENIHGTWSARGRAAHPR